MIQVGDIVAHVDNPNTTTAYGVVEKIDTKHNYTRAWVYWFKTSDILIYSIDMLWKVQ
jgi:hypothetical protein